MIVSLLMPSLWSRPAAAQPASLQEIDSQFLTSTPTLKLVVADFNLDNFNDLAALRFDSSNIDQHRVIVQFRQTPPRGSSVKFVTSQVLPARLPVDVAVADIDADGDADLLVAQDDGDDALALWINDGGVQRGTPGAFFRAAGQLRAQLVSAVQVLRLTADSTQPRDILLVGGTGRPSVLFATHGFATELSELEPVQILMQPGAIGAEIGDFNGDNRDDVLFFGGQTRLWLNSGSPSDPMVAIASSPFASTGTVFAATARDLDGDNRLDLVLSTVSGEQVYRHTGLDSNGDPQFALVQSIPGAAGGAARGYAWIDADGGGSEALVVARNAVDSSVHPRDGLTFSPAPSQTLVRADTLQTAPLSAGGSPHLWMAGLDPGSHSLWRSDIEAPLLPVVSLRGAAADGSGGYFFGNRIGANLGVLPATPQTLVAQLEVSGDSVAPTPFSAQIPAGRTRTRVVVQVPVNGDAAGQPWTIDLLQIAPASAAVVGQPNRVFAFTFPSPVASEFDLHCFLACMLIGDCHRSRSQGQMDALQKSSGLMGTADEVRLLQRLRDERMAASAGGREYIALYESMQRDLYIASFVDPAIYGQLWQLKDAWMPAVASIVDGDGSVTISGEMQDRLLDVLLQFETHGSMALQAAIARERTKLDVANLVGRPISVLQQRWEASQLFADSFE